MRIGFYGGSFDPPHRMHLAMAQAARSGFALHRVLLAPVASQPLKPNGAHASFADRLAMTRLLCERQAGVEASDADGPRPGGEPNFTIDTLRRLLAAEPQAELFVIVGADAFSELRRWRESDELLRIAQWIVLGRPGVPGLDLEQVVTNAQERARVHRLEAPLDPLSSSALRDELRAGRDVSVDVPAAVLGYIHEHHLYGT
jgi:nicotinate-nucleotide adenylyltransferase